MLGLLCLFNEHAYMHDFFIKFHKLLSHPLILFEFLLELLDSVDAVKQICSHTLQGTKGAAKLGEAAHTLFEAREIFTLAPLKFANTMLHVTEVALRVTQANEV